MKKAQIAVLGVALTAGVAAYVLMPTQQPQQVQVAQPIAPVVDNDDVLVAALPLEYGKRLDETMMHWQAWPKSSPIQGVIRKSAQPNAIQDLKGWIVRGNFMAEEPMRKERLVNGPTAGLMATLVEQGKRAIAINIDASGSTSAGGFVLPNDRVDILRTYRDEDAAKSGSPDAFMTETLLRNVKVLAIGPNVQTENGKTVIVGSNATLELDPKQTETITQAQRTGQLSLALRSLLDTVADAKPEEPTDTKPDDKSITIIRYGVSTSARPK